MRFRYGIIKQSVLKAFYDDLLVKGVTKESAKEYVNEFQDEETENISIRIRQIAKKLKRL